MKTNIRLMAMASVALLAMEACSDDDYEPSESSGSEGSIPVTFEMGIASLSRTEYDSSDGTTSRFISGDEVGIFAYKDGEAVNTNVLYTYDGSSWTSDDPIYAEIGESYSFYAYYPYDSSVTDVSAVNVSIDEDQSTNGYTDSDALMANITVEDVASDKTVTLEFSHAFSLLDVVLTGDAASADATVTLMNILPSASVDLTSLTVGTAYGTTTSVIMMPAGEDSAEGEYTFRAIVPAQTISEGSTLFTVACENGKTYGYAYAGEFPYEQGCYRQITVTVNANSEITVSGESSINDWESSSTSIDEDAFSYSEYTDGSLTTNSSGDNGTDISWSNNGTDITINATND